MNSQHAAIFDEHFRERYGKRLEPRDELDVFDTSIESIRAKSLEPLNKVSTRTPQNAIRRLYADFFLSDQFNAIAMCAETHPLDLIGVSFGVLPCVNVLTAFVARYYSETEPPPADVAERIRITRWFDLDSVMQCYSDLHSTGAFDYRSQGTQQIRNTLADGMVDCVLMHEFGHICMGHVGFCKEQLGFPNMSEQNTHNIERDLNHVMEMEADRFMMSVVRAAGDSVDAVVIRLLACMLLFDVFYGSCYNFGDHKVRTHPHPSLRSYSLLQILHNEVRFGSEFDKYVAKQKDLLSGLEGTGLLITSLHAMWEESVAEEYARLREEYKRTHAPALKRYRRRQ